jgi:hypothetical protein
MATDDGNVLELVVSAAAERTLTLMVHGERVHAA